MMKFLLNLTFGSGLLLLYCGRIQMIKENKMSLNEILNKLPYHKRKIFELKIEKIKLDMMILYDTKSQNCSIGTFYAS